MPWTEDQERLINHEIFMREVSKIRFAGSENQRKPAWQVFLESTGGAALITVLLGGLAGAWISGLIQQRAKERELALLGHREFLHKRLEVVTSTYETIGSVISASDTLIMLTSKHWQGEIDSVPEQEKLNAQKEKLLGRVNEAVMRWAQERETLGFLIAYYHPSNPGLHASWNKVMLSVDKVIECAQIWHLEHSEAPANLEVACRPEKESLRAEWAALTLEIGNQ